MEHWHRTWSYAVIQHPQSGGSSPVQQWHCCNFKLVPVSACSHFQLARDGHFLRMIPSLSGGLYQFNGENVEIIPFTADDLLQSSFRFKDDLVLTGSLSQLLY